MKTSGGATHQLSACLAVSEVGLSLKKEEKNTKTLAEFLTLVFSIYFHTVSQFPVISNIPNKPFLWPILLHNFYR